MRYLILIFTLSFYTSIIPAQPTLLASVEYVEINNATTAPPVEKRKAKKKKKQQVKKRFKKPNKTKKNPNRDWIKVGLLFNLIATSSTLTFFLILALVLTGIEKAIALFSMLIALGCFLVFLIIFLIYMLTEKKRLAKKTVIKKSEAALKAEVPYLSEEKVNRYLELNNELTAIKIQRSNLLRTQKERGRIATKLEIRELDVQIKRIQAQISELRRQNKTIKVRRERS
ncbi:MULTISPECIES: hypothetical protein [unclassified Aureispira]|uniref:hypothetical protein n=1 Tax=unclassified Aureispira TaxID=2649989 RepID=UPI0006982B74|nr:MULTISPECIES: hypothetical protein [unclassified Aureispira]WMX16198.1 hypothetical protein QP953_07455 [Aureispira sp. CCB-E]